MSTSEQAITVNHIEHATTSVATPDAIPDEKKNGS